MVVGVVRKFQLTTPTACMDSFGAVGDSAGQGVKSFPKRVVSVRSGPKSRGTSWSSSSALRSGSGRVPGREDWSGGAVPVFGVDLPGARARSLLSGPRFAQYSPGLGPAGTHCRSRPGRLASRQPLAQGWCRAASWGPPPAAPGTLHPGQRPEKATVRVWPVPLEMPSAAFRGKPTGRGGGRALRGRPRRKRRAPGSGARRLARVDE